VNGDLDTSFGGTSATPPGVIVSDIPAADVLKLMPDGRFLVASGGRISRFRGDGTIDPKFTPDAPTKFKYAFTISDIDVQADGRIVLAGRYRHFLLTPGQFAVARLRSNGLKDVSFGSGGVMDSGPHIRGIATCVRAIDDDSFVVAGYEDRGYLTDLDEYRTEDIMTMKFRPDGTFDPNFGTNGIATKTFRFFAGAEMLADIDSAGATTTVAYGDDLRIFRFDSAGQYLTVGIGHTTGGSVSSVALERDGGIVFTSVNVTGQLVRNDNLSRFSAGNIIDQSFGASGIATLDLHGTEVQFHTSAIANDGSILTAGSSEGKLLLARYWRDEAPAAQLFAPSLTLPSANSIRSNVGIRDDVKIEIASIDSTDFRVVAPDGSVRKPIFMSIDRKQNDALCGVNLKLPSPGGSWAAPDNGIYRIQILANHIKDTAGHYMSGRTIGTIEVKIPAA